MILSVDGDLLATCCTWLQWTTGCQWYVLYSQWLCYYITWAVFSILKTTVDLFQTCPKSPSPHFHFTFLLPLTIHCLIHYPLPLTWMCCLSHLPLIIVCDRLLEIVSIDCTYLPLFRMTVQFGQQSWLTRQRLGKIPTPTACRPLWSLIMKPLQLI